MCTVLGVWYIRVVGKLNSEFDCGSITRGFRTPRGFRINGTEGMGAETNGVDGTRTKNMGVQGMGVKGMSVEDMSAEDMSAGDMSVDAAVEVGTGANKDLDDASAEL